MFFISNAFPKQFKTNIRMIFIHRPTFVLFQRHVKYRFYIVISHNTFII